MYLFADRVKARDSEPPVMPVSPRKHSRTRNGATERRGTKPHSAAGYAPPLTTSHDALMEGGTDVAFRRSLYLMVLAFSRLAACREAFGRALGLTGSQFAVLIGTAYRQGRDGVSIRALADHIALASTHVTTEVGRLIDRGLLAKSANPRDRRGVLVRLTRRGEAAVNDVAPFVRRVNDRLFAGVSRREFAAVSAFLARFAANSEDALEEIHRDERRRRAPADGLTD
jgi:MarR family transcriptional regulator, organic hydroperoxide resistance regulator